MVLGVKQFKLAMGRKTGEEKTGRKKTDAKKADGKKKK